jgi:quercetin dioxygenase-like cupin family protein
MMKHLIVFVSFAIVGWMVPAYAQDAEPKVVPDAEYAIAQEMKLEGPTETVGIESSTILGAVPLGGDFEALKGRKLRARVVVVLPGARIAVHMHEQRPGVAYLIEGELVEHRSDTEKPLTRHAGDASFEKTGIVHWWENLSANKARVLVVDIVPEDLE